MEKIEFIRRASFGDGVLDAAYLAAIVDSSEDCIIGKDLSGIIRSWNRAAQTIFGYEAAEVIGRSVEILFPPELIGEEARIVEWIRRGVRVEHHESIRRRKDGSDFPASITVSPIRDVSGAVVGASKILRDITERREAQRALALNEAELRASFESTVIGKALLAPADRRIVRANQALANMLGCQPKDLVGRALADFVWADDQIMDAFGESNLLSGDAAVHIRELRLMGQDGAPLWVRASTTLAMEPGTGRPFLAVIAVEDIDALHKAQMDLLAAKRDLEQVVIERTKALAERSLLLREVYHRVKNNLQVVDGLLMMQGQKFQDPQGRQVLMDLRSRVFALGLVHQQLMGSSNLKTFDIAPFLRELLDNILVGAAHDTIRLTVEACPLEVGLDFAAPLGLLVTEIVTNSLKHAFPDGSGDVSVILRPGGHQEVVLIVSDNGQGLSVGPRPSAGGGMGTTIIKSLVAQLEGAMIVRQNPGTTTEIRLPLPESS
jgi:PAS domain S-box-containing protein